MLLAAGGDDVEWRWGVDAERLHRDYARAREEFKRALVDVVWELDGDAAGSAEAECVRLLRHSS